jgi:hypothetical protein
MLRLTSLILVCGCASTSGVAAGPTAKPTVTASDFYPLVVGTVWKYQMNFLGEKRAMEVKMLKAEAGVYEDSTGNQLQADNYGVRDQKRYLLRNPIEVGTRWSNVVSPSSMESYEIVGVNQPCDAPGAPETGCVIVQAKNRVKGDEFLVMETTFAPKVGIVRLSTMLETKAKRIPQTQLSLVGFVSGNPTSGER